MNKRKVFSLFCNILKFKGLLSNFKKFDYWQNFYRIQENFTSLFLGTNWNFKGSIVSYEKLKDYCAITQKVWKYLKKKKLISLWLEVSRLFFQIWEGVADPPILLYKNIYIFFNSINCSNSIFSIFQLHYFLQLSILLL